MALLREYFDETVQGRGTAVLVSGAVAGGKSELLHAFTEHVKEAGALVLSAAGSQLERELPLALLGQLFENTALGNGVRERARALLAEGAEAVPVGQLRMQDMLALCGLLLEVSRERPVVLTVDDLQHADAASLQFLLFVVRRIRTARIALVMTESAGARQPVHSLFHVELLRQPCGHRIRLEPLSEDSVAEFVAAELGHPIEPAGDVYRFSGGNPLLAKALLEDWLVSGGNGEVIPGDTYAQAVLGCLWRGDAETREIASALAVLGDLGTPELAGRLSGLDGVTTANVVEVLRWSGLSDERGFRHPLIAATVLADLAAADREALHLRAANLLHNDGASVLEVARHLVAVGRSEETWGVSVLRNAAELALVDDQVQFAVRCFELACQVCRNDGLRVEMLTALAGLEWRNNPAIGARHLDELFDAFRAGRLPPRESAVLLRFLLWHGRTDAAGEILAWLNGLDTDLDARTEAELWVTQFFITCSYPSLQVGLPAANDPAAHAKRWQGINDPSVQVAAALTKILMQGPDDEAIASTEHVLQSQQLGDTMLETVRCALFALIYADRMDKAVSWCDLLQREAADRGAPAWQAVFAAARAEIAFRQGDLSMAEKQARAALSLMAPQSWGVAVGAPLATLCQALTAMGRLDEAAAEISRPVPSAMLQTRFGLQYLLARGHFFLETNRAHAALGDFVSCGDLARCWDLDLPTLIPWRSGAARAYLLLGRRAKAGALLDEQLGMLGAGRSHVRGTTLRLKAEAGEQRQRPELLREAVRIFRAGGARLELAQALANLSQAEYALGDAGQARALARQAWRIAKGCHAEPICRALSTHREQPETLSVPAFVVSAEEREQISSLSDAELRVAALASLGHTNREIAGWLYVTVSTVEQHLTRVYRKLNVHRRRDLPSGLQVAVTDAV